MADFTDLITVITLLKNLLMTSFAADKEARERIAAMSDEEVVAYARELAADTESRAEAFIDRLENTP